MEAEDAGGDKWAGRAPFSLEEDVNQAGGLGTSQQAKQWLAGAKRN